MFDASETRVDRRHPKPSSLDLRRTPPNVGGEPGRGLTHLGKGEKNGGRARAALGDGEEVLCDGATSLAGAVEPPHHEAVEVLPTPSPASSARCPPRSTPPPCTAAPPPVARHPHKPAGRGQLSKSRGGGTADARSLLPALTPATPTFALISPAPIPAGWSRRPLGPLERRTETKARVAVRSVPAAGCRRRRSTGSPPAAPAGGGPSPPPAGPAARRPPGAPAPPPAAARGAPAASCGSPTSPRCTRCQTPCTCAPPGGGGGEPQRGPESGRRGAIQQTPAVRGGPQQ
eukprot:30706-Prorocentrum_minimum.AAC.2